MIDNAIMATPEEPKPIPAFYCCYLLRSTMRHTSLYIGSTPNPMRRLEQHNGVTKGGAHRTSREALRPWEIIVIVDGFMSRIGALQFEWAWQNTHNSRHVDTEDISAHTPKVRNNNSQRGRDTSTKKSLRSRSLTSHLAKLHLLLRSPYFSRWPLKVRFFSQDVYRVWQVWSERVDGLLSDRIQIVSNTGPFSALSSKHTRNNINSSDIHRLDISYGRIKEYLEKALVILGESSQVDCGVCQQQILVKEDIAVVCPREDCCCVCHMTCLSESFLQSAGTPDQIIPTEGSCPACKVIIQWASLMKELSLRIRREKEIQVTSKTRRKRSPNLGRIGAACNRKAKADGAIVPAGSHKEYTSTIDKVPDSHAKVKEAIYKDELPDYYGNDEQLNVNWIEFVDLGTESNGSSDQEKALPKPSQSRIEIVIEDSDCGDVEI